VETFREHIHPSITTVVIEVEEHDYSGDGHYVAIMDPCDDPPLRCANVDVRVQTIFYRHLASYVQVNPDFGMATLRLYSRDSRVAKMGDFLTLAQRLGARYLAIRDIPARVLFSQFPARPTYASTPKGFKGTLPYSDTMYPHRVITAPGSVFPDFKKIYINVIGPVKEADVRRLLGASECVCVWDGWAAVDRRAARDLRPRHVHDAQCERADSVRGPDERRRAVDGGVGAGGAVVPGRGPERGRRDCGLKREKRERRAEGRRQVERREKS